MRLKWDQTGDRLFETGVDRVVLFPIGSDGSYTNGVVWNGVTAINEKPSGAEATKLWADNIKYGELVSAEEFAATIEAYTYPDEFGECNGEVEIAPGVVVAQQKRKKFGLCYRSLIGNDVDGDAHGYLIHVIYGGLAAPSEKNRQTVNESPEAGTMSWEISTTPVEVPGKKPTAHVQISSLKADETKLAALEDILYGSDGEGGTGTMARLPLPQELATLLGSAG